MPNTVATASGRTGIRSTERREGFSESPIGHVRIMAKKPENLGVTSSRLRVSNSEARTPSSGGGADDAGAGEAVVEAAVIAADERGHEPESRGNGKQHPHRGAKKGAAQIERPCR